jgi:transposase
VTGGLDTCGTIHPMSKRLKFREYCPDQPLLLPPDLKDWLPEEHLVYFLRDVVDSLDLKPIYRKYDARKGGQPAYHPAMMVSLLFYAYCVGIPSSRKIERQTYDSVAFRVLTAGEHPDHDTIAAFRQSHLTELAGLFVQVLRLCQKAGLVKLGHVALDGTKMRANASKHKANSYDRMEKKEAELRAEVERLLAEAAATDEQEDRAHGRGKKAEDVPKELRFKQARLAKIQEAKLALEAEAKAAAEAKRQEMEAKGNNGPPPSDKPDPKAQRNYTDPDSRIMLDGATKAFAQCYNCEAAVDAEAQIIVGCNVTQQANDKRQLVPLMEELASNLDGALPERLSADAGFFSEENVAYVEHKHVDGYIATQKIKHSQPVATAPRGRIPQNATIAERMARKLRTVRGRATYSRRKQIVEPVFGQMKEGRGLRRFLMRGLDKVSGEWDLMCLTHNLLKLFRSGWQVSEA